MRFGKAFGWAFGAAAAAGLALAPAAMAGVVSSNHDMIVKMGYTAATAKAGVCSFCHIPHKAGGSKLWAESTVASGGSWDSDPITALCYSCHGGTTYTGAQEQNPFANNIKHGRDVEALVGFGDVADRATLTTAIGGATRLSTAADADLKCTSCHDVHDNSSRPFLRFTGGTFANFDGHCTTCHARRANAGPLRGLANSIAAGANFSQHPTNVGINATGNTRIAVQGTISTALSQVPGTQVAGVAGAAGWNLGGHRQLGLATGSMTCATCHAVHGNETADYTAADGASPVATAVAGIEDLTVLAGATPTNAVEPICLGCHVNAAGSGPGASGFSHPIGTVQSTEPWTVSIPAVRPAGTKWGTVVGANDLIVCQTCHDMHYATNQTSLLVGPIDGAAGVSNANCNICHATSTYAGHHPAGIAYPPSGGSGWPAAPVAESVAMAYTLADPGAQTNGGATYAFPGGLMTCATCHSGTGGAHNNAGSFPGLTGVNVGSEMCVDCHGVNPSPRTGTVGLGTGSATLAQASHYIGQIQTAGYKKTTAWTNGLSSKYAAPGANGSIICESCHSLRQGNATSDNTVSGTAIRAGVRLLVETAGNDLTTFYSTTGTGPDMCTGCHGGSPSGGTASAASGTATHPTISYGMTVAASAGIQATMGATPRATSTLNTANMVNCESCHRPHDAAAGSGAIILENVGTASDKNAGLSTATAMAGAAFDRTDTNGGAGYAEEATFCQRCHAL